MSALHGDVEGHPGDAPDLGLLVDQGIDPLALAVVQGLHAARLAEVDAAGELAHDHDVQPGHHLGAQGGCTGQLRVEDGRAQIGEQVQAGAQPQQALFGAQGHVQVVPAVAAHRPEQDGVRLAGQAQGLLGQGVAVGVIGAAADQGPLLLDVQAVGLAQEIEDLDRLGDHFGTDAVPGQDE